LPSLDAANISVQISRLEPPTGTQTHASLKGRRWVFALLNLLTYGVMMGLIARVLGVSGWTWVDVVLMGSFALALPWTVMGVWNALIGLAILTFSREPLSVVAPFALDVDEAEPIRVRTAVIMTLRNENPARAFERMRIIKHSLDSTGFGHQYDYFILSDTHDPIIASAEEGLFKRWQEMQEDPSQVMYRRRTDNEGYKAGNIRDFCIRWGDDYELMLPLDADSLMTGKTILHMTRIMQAHAKLGILQSLVVGVPSQSLFARFFQFGMRHGMRPYTVGSAWWQGDCGPYWGHNALLRIKPFRDHCDLPIVRGQGVLSGHVLSHDQIEAAMMRAAGFEVRVLPVETGSYEENPPTILEFMRRDVRWCQGNLQYIKLLRLPNLLTVSRFQLVWAILMFVGVPAWSVIMAMLPFKVWDGEPLNAFPTQDAIKLYVVFLIMSLTPKFAGFLNILFTKGEAKRYGGAGLFVWGAVSETLFSFLMGALTTFRVTLFMIGLAFGRSIVWNGQHRDTHAIPWGTAIQQTGFAFVFGLSISIALFIAAPVLLLWVLPLLAGYLVAFPLVVLTASPRLGALCTRLHLCAIPEDFNPPQELVWLESLTSV
jgi:membrane glycosyltransferase